MLALIMTIENEDDREKAAEIYRHYCRIMLYIARNILHDTYLAEDAVSEAFIRIMDNLEKIRTVDCYQTKGFVVIIVRNVSLNMLKKQNHEKTVPFEDYQDYSLSEEPGFDDMTSKEACTKIFKAIKMLNKSYSDILYLKFEFDLSNREISKILGIREENAKMRLCRARKALKEQLLMEENSI